MKLLCQSIHVEYLYMFKGFLESKGIACEVKRENMTGFAGRLPAIECLAELWVINALDFDKAVSLLAEQAKNESAESDADTWQCPYCREENDANFDICWNCQKEKA